MVAREPSLPAITPALSAASASSDLPTNRILKFIYRAVRGLQLASAFHGLGYIAALLAEQDRPLLLLGLIGFVWLTGEGLATIGADTVKDYSLAGTVTFAVLAVIFAAIPILVFWLT
jgi:hypothetical protein